MFGKGQCSKCGASQLMPAVRVVYKSEGGDRDVTLRIDACPKAILFKQAQRSTLSASVCGSCGYTEFFAEEPSSLYSAYQASQQ